MYDFTDLSNDLNGYIQIAKFYNTYKNNEFSKIDVSINGFTCANMVAPLGGILGVIEDDFNTVHINVDNSAAEMILQKNEFLSFYGYDTVVDTNHTALPFKKFKTTDSVRFAEYVDKWLLGRGEMPVLSDVLRNEIWQGITELFANAATHSKTEYIYVCGQFYPYKHELYLTIADTGHGIKDTVNNAKNYNLSTTEAVKWALTKTNSTKIGIPGGLGFDIVKEFIRVNKGVLQIVTGDIFYEMRRDGDNFHNLQYEYKGTVVSLQFRTDDKKKYKLKNE